MKSNRSFEAFKTASILLNLSALSRWMGKGDRYLRDVQRGRIKWTPALADEIATALSELNLRIIK